jgi:hypothetical protein
MRKLIITVASLLALAVPAAGMAAVAVDSNGVGTVGKSDVKGLFGGNDAAFQNYAPSVTFTATHSETIDNTIKCGVYAGFVGGKPVFTQTGTYHVVNTTPVTQTVNATTTLGGSKINGWDLTGLGAPVYGAHTSEVTGACPAGSYDIGGSTQSISISPTVLRVTQGTRTFDLPNTPVEPVIAPTV